MADILISGGAVITMNPDRAVIDDGAVAIQGDRIVAVGPRREVEAAHTALEHIDASRKVVMPGLIDGHGHAGHGLVKTLGSGVSSLWYEACEKIYAEASDEEFWHQEALLTSLGRLKFGVTCGVSYLGGGDSVMRTDDPVFGDLHCKATEQVGVREFVAVGPRRPPFPSQFSRWNGDQKRNTDVSMEQQLETSESLIERWHGGADGKISVCMTLPVHDPRIYGDGVRAVGEAVAQARAVREITRRHGVLFTQDGHTTGSIKFAHDILDILGPDALMSHSTGLTEEEIRLCAETDTKIVHNPSSAASYAAHCPVPDLLDAGVTVILGTDGTAPDRSYDMFRHMFQCSRHHRSYYKDPSLMPPGKVLEMTTIDSAKALGLENNLGSLETGKKADVILIDMFKPHLYPLNMPVHRVVGFANGNDIDTVIVDGKVLMRNRSVVTIDEAEVLEGAQRATETMLDRSGLRHLLNDADGFWGASRLS